MTAKKGFPLKMLRRRYEARRRSPSWRGVGSAQDPKKPTVLRLSEMHSEPLKDSILPNEVNDMKVKSTQICMSDINTPLGLWSMILFIHFISETNNIF